MITHVLLLAAGASTRMGQSKQLISLYGETLLARATRTALGASPYVTVVLGADSNAHRVLLEDFPVHVVENPGWSSGMGTSLKEGLASIRMSDPPAEAVMVMLCDQPDVTTAHLKMLMAKAKESPKGIVASGYDHTMGAPALFKPGMFDRLAGIADDGGASKLIREIPDDVAVVDFPGGSVDLDTPQDLDRYLGRQGGTQ